jgi:hypothetical protein
VLPDNDLTDARDKALPYAGELVEERAVIHRRQRQGLYRISQWDLPLDGSEPPVRRMRS